MIMHERPTLRGWQQHIVDGYIIIFKRKIKCATFYIIAHKRNCQWALEPPEHLIMKTRSSQGNSIH